MREGHAWSVPVGFHFLLEGRKKAACFLYDERQRLFQPDCIHIVQNIHAGGAKVDDGACFRTLLCISLDLCHQVVPDLAFDLRGSLNVNVAGMCLKLVDLPLADQTCL